MGPSSAHFTPVENFVKGLARGFLIKLLIR